MYEYYESQLYPEELYHSSDELYHYGVLGMKWGVRRNPKQAKARAQKELARLKSKSEFYKKKKDTHYAKSGRYYLTDIGKSRNDFHTYRSRRNAFKKYRTDKKIARMEKEMRKTFSKENLQKISDAKIDKLYKKYDDRIYRESNATMRRALENDKWRNINRVRKQYGTDLPTTERQWVRVDKNGKQHDITKKIQQKEINLAKKYDKKLKNAKNDDERAKIELDWLEELDNDVYG